MIPKNLVTNILKIQFEIPGALSVSEHVVGEDVRRLGIGINNFLIELSGAGVK
jgi:hypothetical protein